MSPCLQGLRVWGTIIRRRLLNLSMSACKSIIITSIPSRCPNIIYACLPLFCSIPHTSHVLRVRRLLTSSPAQHAYTSKPPFQRYITWRTTKGNGARATIRSRSGAQSHLPLHSNFPAITTHDSRPGLIRKASVHVDPHQRLPSNMPCRTSSTQHHGLHASPLALTRLWNHLAGMCNAQKKGVEQPKRGVNNKSVQRAKRCVCNNPNGVCRASPKQMYVQQPKRGMYNKGVKRPKTGRVQRSASKREGCKREKVIWLNLRCQHGPTAHSLILNELLCTPVDSQRVTNSVRLPKTTELNSHISLQSRSTHCTWPQRTK